MAQQVAFREQLLTDLAKATGAAAYRFALVKWEVRRTVCVAGRLSLA